LASTQQQSAFALDSTAFGGRHPAASALGRALRSGLETLIVWQQRESERRQLASLSDFHLNDMGLTRADVDREVIKPFWRA